MGSQDGGVGKSELCKVGHRPDTQAGFLHYILEAELLLQETSAFALKAFN